MFAAWASVISGVTTINRVVIISLTIIIYVLPGNKCFLASRWKSSSSTLQTGHNANYLCHNWFTLNGLWRGK